MSSFFRNFPIVPYKFGDETKPALFQNLSVYIDIFEQVVNQGSFYEDYYIQEGERPDVISHKIYGTDKFYWTLFLANEKLREKGWPLDNNELHNLKNKLFPGISQTVAYNPIARETEGPILVEGVDANFYEFERNKDNFLNFVKPGAILGLKNLGVSVLSEFFTQVVNVNYQTGVYTMQPLNSIVYVKVEYGGTGYDVAPTLVVEGQGQGAELTAVVSGGSITQVIVNKVGYGYEESWDGTGTFPATRTNVYDPALEITFSALKYIPNFSSPLRIPKVKIIRNSPTTGEDAELKPYVLPSYIYLGTASPTGQFTGRYNIVASTDKDNLTLDPEYLTDLYGDDAYVIVANKLNIFNVDSLYEFRDSNDQPIDFTIWDKNLEWYQDSAGENPAAINPRFYAASGNYVYPGTPITKFDALTEMNENLRKIRVLKPEIANQVLYEFNKKLKETNT